MKRILFASLLLISSISVHASNEQNNEVAPLVDSDSISGKIGQAFIHDRAQSIDKWDGKTQTLWKSIFSSYSNSVNLHDVKMAVKREGYEGLDCLIISMDIVGSPEDFRGEGILKHEEGLLKHSVISQYLDIISQSKDTTSVSVVLDDHSKVIQPPEFLVYERENNFGFGKHIEKSTTRKGMPVVIIFSVKEFKDMIRHYVKEQEAKHEGALSKKKTSGWW